MPEVDSALRNALSERVVQPAAILWNAELDGSILKVEGLASVAGSISRLAKLAAGLPPNGKRPAVYAARA